MMKIQYNTRQYDKLEVNYRGASRRGRSRVQPALGDYRIDDPEGVGIMPEVSWTSDTCVGCVFGVVDLFRTTFMFGINSSGYCSSTGQIIGQTVQRGAVRCSVC